MLEYFFVRAVVEQPPSQSLRLGAPVGCRLSLASSLGHGLGKVRDAFARREGITHVIFGQTARSRWEILWKGSTIDRFLEEVRDAAVQVIPLDSSASNVG